MSDDGRIRCPWVTAATARSESDAQLYRAYHDEEWGRPVRDGAGLFERLSLEAFQSGLSWLVILRKRENFRRAFDGFDAARVARYRDDDVQRLLTDPGIVRNRAKVQATIANARVIDQIGLDGFAELLWSFAPPPRPRPVDVADVAATSAESTEMARELKHRGFRFVGPTTAYALMQAVGMVDDHVRDCWVDDLGSA